MLSAGSLQLFFLVQLWKGSAVVGAIGTAQKTGEALLYRGRTGKKVFRRGDPLWYRDGDVALPGTWISRDDNNVLLLAHCGSERILVRRRDVVRRRLMESVAYKEWENVAGDS